MGRGKGEGGERKRGERWDRNWCLAFGRMILDCYDYGNGHEGFWHVLVLICRSMGLRSG
jgi:hypothetical protein